MPVACDNLSVEDGQNGCVAEWKRQQGYAVQESAAHSNLLGLKQPPRTGIKLVAYCLHHAGFKSPPHPPKRPFVGVVALSTNKVQPSAATASVWQYAAFGKGQRRATGLRQFDSAEPYQRSLQICRVSIICYGRCRENAVIMTQIRRFAPCPPSDDFPRWNETSASGSGVIGLI